MTEGTTNRGRRTVRAHVARSRGTYRRLAGLVAAEAFLVGGYLATTTTTVLSVRYAVYPFVWVNLVVLAVAAVDVPRPSNRRSVIAAGVATLYIGVLAWTAGLLGPGTGGALSVRVFPALPGWGPVLLVDGPLRAAVVPFKAVGYVGLAVLVYAGLARASTGVLSGILGAATCVSCVGSVVTGLASGVAGGAATAAAGAASGGYAYDLSTALFVVTVGSLWYALR